MRIISLIALLCVVSVSQAKDRPPNVVIVITDDQGYGDIGAHGNSKIKTPSLDVLHRKSVRLTDYHVDPTCAPTRAALLTGRYSTRTGVWHTILGRSLMRPEELTLPEIFKANGYTTGMFGKWHLGDNYPLRPEDQGFDDTVYHKGGGVGQGPDAWGNDYFDDTYFRNGVPEKFEGYCTDVWFQEATRFVKTNKDKPFFCYLSTNAPHSPYFVDPKYSEPYQKDGVPSTMAKFYGMITNIDENVGKLRGVLRTMGLEENTIFIFTTDNGTAAGLARQKDKAPWKGFNIGMRGTKGSEYDGGHRVPCFWHWPDGGLTGGKDVDLLTAHIDMVPTLVDLCGLAKPNGPAVDGLSLKSWLTDPSIAQPDRTILVHSQRILHPEKWRKTAVMTKRWRLVNGTELYDMSKDPGQTSNLADKHTKEFETLRGSYDAWWRSMKDIMKTDVAISIGSDAEPVVQLHCHDWQSKSGGCPWHQNHVTKGMVSNGEWVLDVEQPGTYAFELRRWPRVLDQSIEATHAKMVLGSKTYDINVTGDPTNVVFNLPLEAGRNRLRTTLTMPDGKERGAYYTYVERVE